MKIFDCHVHLGDDCVFDLKQTESEILHSHAEHNVVGGLIHSYRMRPYPTIVKESNKRVSEFCRKNPNYFAAASIEPHFRPEDFDSLADYCVNDLKHKALTILPDAHACKINNIDAIHVYETCRRLEVPVIIHIGGSFPFSDPIQLEKPLQEFSDVTFVLTQFNIEPDLFKVLSILERFENVVCCPDNCSISALQRIKDIAGTDRVMFSSGNLLELKAGIIRYQSVFPALSAQEKVFFENAARVFKLVNH